MELISVMLFAAIASCGADATDFHNWAKTPPMGWNSWDCFGTTLTEAQSREQADMQAKWLLPAGYKYHTVDIQWYEPDSVRHWYRDGAKLEMDGYGRLLPAVKKFPSSAGGKGFKPLADYVHSKGLKFAIHMMRGIPRQAVEQNTPVLGTSFHAKDIANVNDKCGWNPDKFGVDMTKPGAQEYYDSVFAQYAAWGVDFVKDGPRDRPLAFAWRHAALPRCACRGACQHVARVRRLLGQVGAASRTLRTPPQVDGVPPRRQLARRRHASVRRRRLRTEDAVHGG